MLLIRLLSISVVIAAAAPAHAGKFNRVLSVGDKAPGWKQLLGIDGKRHSLSDLKDARLVVLMFISNRCPTTKNYEARIRAFLKKYKPRGVRLVAVNPQQGPSETFLKMMQRAKTAGFDFPYLRDAGQQTAKAWGATHTPHFFLLDGKRRIAYMGAFDDNADAAKVTEHSLADAVEALLSGKRPEVGETLQFGCPIEYKTK